MATMTARIEDWLKSDVEDFWEAHGEKPSPGLRRVIQEWWATQRFPEITFRDGVSGRRAVLRNGPDVWEVAMVAPGYRHDTAAISAHFAGINQQALDQALAYAARFPDEISAILTENARVERLLGG